MVLRRGAAWLKQGPWGEGANERSRMTKQMKIGAPIPMDCYTHEALLLCHFQAKPTQCEEMFPMGQKAVRVRLALKLDFPQSEAPLEIKNNKKPAHVLIPESSLFLCIRNPAQAIQIKTK